MRRKALFLGILALIGTMAKGNTIENLNLDGGNDTIIIEGQEDRIIVGKGEDEIIEEDIIVDNNHPIESLTAIYAGGDSSATYTGEMTIYGHGTGMATDSSSGGTVTNEGTISLEGEDWHDQYGMVAQGGGHAENNGTINVTGMRGTAMEARGEGSTIVNGEDGEINVENGVAMNVEGGAHGENQGTINVDDGGSAVKIDDESTFENNGTINVSSDSTVIHGVDREESLGNAKNAADEEIKEWREKDKGFENNGTINVELSHSMIDSLTVEGDELSINAGENSATFSEDPEGNIIVTMNGKQGTLVRGEDHEGHRTWKIDTGEGETKEVYFEGGEIKFVDGTELPETPETPEDPEDGKPGNPVVRDPQAAASHMQQTYQNDYAALNSRVDQTRSEMKGIGAQSAALTASSVMATQNLEVGEVGVGVGHGSYSDANAQSIALGTKVNENLSVTAGWSHSDSNSDMWNAGFGYKFNLFGN